MPMSTDYSSDGLFTFLREAALAGRMTPAAARSRRAAAAALFPKLTEDEMGDLRRLNLEDLKSRFRDTQIDGLRREVVDLYATRLEGALGDYFRFVEAPSDFFSSATPHQGVQRREKQSTRSYEERALETVLLSAVRQRPDVIPVPLATGRIAYLHGIPADLTTQEARKIARVVEALANEPDDEP
jgi:hypothetical protein